MGSHGQRSLRTAGSESGIEEAGDSEHELSMKEKGAKLR